MRSTLSASLTIAILAGWGICGDAPKVIGQAPDPVESLRQVLRDTGKSLPERDRLLKTQVETLTGLTDLGQALILPGWQDDDVDQERLTVDSRHRRTVAMRLEDVVRQQLLGGTEKERLQLVNMAAELARTAEPVIERTGLAKSWAQDLAVLVNDPSPGVRQKAALALGQVSNDPERVAASLERMLTDADVAQRQAAMRGLVALAGRVLEKGQGKATPAPMPAAALVRALASRVAHALADSDVEVRRLGAEAFVSVAAELYQLIVNAKLQPMSVAEVRSEQPVRSTLDLKPLIREVNPQVPILLEAWRDRDVRVRYLVGKSLETLAACRQQLVGADSEQKLPVDPLLDAMGSNLAALADLVSSPSVSTRRTAVDILATLGRTAAPAGPALTRALTDIDPFVRWGAARALGRTAPEAENSYIIALSDRLNDNDPDVRRAAATALASFGPAARGAVPNLGMALYANDPELRLAAVRALKRIGPDAVAALRALRKAEQDPDSRVRQLAAEIVTKIDEAGQ
jgi:HEAT repeat protein